MPGKLKTEIGQRLIFEMRLGGVLEFACEKGDDSSGEAFDRRAGAAGRQVHFAPGGDDCRAGRRVFETFQLLDQSGLYVDAQLFARTGCNYRTRGNECAH